MTLQFSQIIRRNVGSGLFLSLFFVVVYWNVLFFPKILAGIDFQIPLQSPQSYLHLILGNWSENGLGSASFPDFSFYNTVFSGIIYLLSAGNRVLAQKIFISAILWSSINMYVFCQNHLTRSRAASVAASLVYAYNPFSTQNFGTGLIWSNALAPLVLNYGYNILEGDKRLRNVAFFASLFSIQASFGIHSLLYVPAILIIQGLFLAARENRKRKYISGVGLRIALVAGILGLLNPGLVNASLGVLGFVTSVPAYGIPHVSVNEFYANYAGSTALSFFTISNWLGYSSLPILGVFLPLFAFSALILPLVPDMKVKSLASSVSIASAYVFVLLVQSKSVVFRSLYQAIPPLAILRGTESLMPIVAFGLAGLWAIILGYWIPRILKRRNHSLFGPTLRRVLPGIVVLFLVLILMTYNPVFTIASQKHSQSFPTASGLESFASTYDDASGYLRSGPENPFRYIVVPAPFTSTLYLPYEYPGVLAPFQGPAASSAYLDIVNNVLVSNATNRWGQFLAPAGVRYIIVPTHPREPDFFAGEIVGPPRISSYGRLVGDPQQFIQWLSSQSDLRLAKTTNEYAIYENIEYIPRISLYSSLTYVDGRIEALPEIFSFPSLSSNESLLYFAGSIPTINDSYLGDLSSNVILFNSQGFLSRPGICMRIDCSSKNLSYVFDPRFFVSQTDAVVFKLYQLNNSIIISVTDPGPNPIPITVMNLFDGPRNLLTLQTPTINSGGTWYSGFEANLVIPGDTLYLADSLGHPLSDSITFQPATFNSYYAKFVLSFPSVENFSMAFQTVTPLAVQAISVWLNGSVTNHPVVTEDKWSYVQGFSQRPGLQNLTLGIPFYEISRIVLYNNHTDLIRGVQVAPRISSDSFGSENYEVNISTARPVFLSLSDSYDVRFSATSEGAKLIHFPSLSWANGFYLERTGVLEVTISYSGNLSRNLVTLALSSFAFVGILAILPPNSYKLFRTGFTKLSRLKTSSLS